MSLLRPGSSRLPIRAARRTFSTTTAVPASLQIDRNDPEAVADTVPAYPHGPARWYKQSNKGLYGGQRIQFGNNVSGDFNTKTRRTFQVNVLNKRIWSHALNRFIQVRVTARTLRTIDRVGGLDEYLLSDNASRIKQLGISGWWLRWAIMQQPSVKARFKRELYGLGLGPKEGYESELKALENKKVGSDLEEAYAALPEEDEVNTAAADAVVDEVAELPLDESLRNMEGVGEHRRSPNPKVLLDVSNPPDSPSLKFRVDRRAHVVLTPKGWMRTQPERSEHTKQQIANKEFPNYVQNRMVGFEAQLEQMKEADVEMRHMSLLEEREILKDARRRFTKELEGKVDRKFEESRMAGVEKRANRERNQALREEKRTRNAQLRGENPERRAGMEPDAFGIAATRAAEQVPA